jgi:arylsulfatase A-like enzyme
MLALLAAAPAVAATSPTVPPNIVFILEDDAGVGDFGCYGSKDILTPNVDRLAAEGMRFTNAYSGSAVCAPTRCVLMTGLHTGHCRRRDNTATGALDQFQGRPLVFLEPADFTVAKLLQRHGYACGGFGKWGLGNPGSEGVPEKQGFDEWFGYYDQVHAHDYYTDHLVSNSQEVPLPGNAGGKKGQYSADVIHAEAMKFLEQNGGKRRFFLYVSYTLPHGQYIIPSDAPHSDKPWPQEIKNYAAMVSLYDRQIGDLLERLKRLRLEENTIIFFSSDNGANPSFVKYLNSAAGLRGVKSQLYEGGIRAPLVVRWPGHIARGTTSDLLTSHVDFLATVADLLGAAPPKDTDGVSILPTLLGQSQTKRHEALYWEIYHPFQQAMRMENWKAFRRGTKMPLELYDLAVDPREGSDVAAQHPEVVKKIEACLTASHVDSLFYPLVERSKAAPDVKGSVKKEKTKRKRSN